MQALPAVDLAQRDLTAGNERPEERASGFGARQQTLGLDAPLELLVQPFDGVGGSDRAPLARRGAQRHFPAEYVGRGLKRQRGTPPPPPNPTVPPSVPPLTSQPP